MALMTLFLLPFAGGLAALLLAGRGGLERWASIAAFVLTALWAIALALTGEGGDPWLARSRAEWMPALGVSANFAMDGLSAALTVVSAALGAIAVLVSRHEIRARSGVFHLCLCWTVAAAIGVFLAMDLLLFVFFWEAMLIPSFLLIALFGHDDAEAAATKYLVFNAVGGLALIGSVLALATLGGPLTFDAFALAEREVPAAAAPWLLGAMALAFLIKLPAVPFHAWLPDAHTQAPTAGSILLAGVLLKTGGYGLFRFPPMLFPEALALLAPLGLALGAFGAIYGGLLAAGQTDAKRLVAFTSVAHMGLVLMGISAGTEIALGGAGVEMIAHAFSGAALFLLIGALEARTGTRDMRILGGLQHSAPRFTASFAVFFAAALAMPGTANFVGEAMVIVGVFQHSWPFAVIAVASLVISVIYATRLLRGVVFGPKPAGAAPADLTRLELGPVILLAACTLGVGLVPTLLLDVIGPSIEAALSERLR